MRPDTPSSGRITTLVLLFPVLALLMYGGLMYLYFAYAQNRDTHWEIMQYEDRLMDTEVSNLKEKVRNLAQYIRYYDSQSADKIKKDVQRIVTAAAKVSEAIWHEMPAPQQRDLADKLVLQSLRQIRFEGKTGYLFVIDENGTTWLHSDPSLVGKRQIDIADANGKQFIREFIRIAREKGEGFVDYYWYIPGEDKRRMRYKISFIKRLSHNGWILGAGEYLHYMRQFIQQDMLRYIRKNARFEDGYFFVTDSAGHTVYHPKGSASHDADRYLIEGPYRDDEHIAYTEYIAQYDWYVTAVKNIQQVRKRIEEQKNHLFKQRYDNIRVSFWIMAAMLVVSLLLSLYLSGIINRRLRAYEEELHASNEKLLFQSRQALIGELMPMIAHQWRQPINKIASVLALLRFGIAKGECDPEEVDRASASMEESIEFMSETIDDFRTFYRPKNETEEVELSALIVKAIEFVDGSIRHKNIRLTTHMQSIRYRLYANEFLQVMINLIKNAADATEPHGHIDIALFKKDDAIRIVVTDDGRGIPDDQMQKIFEPYFSTKENSMGLGLYMSKMIIEKHMHGTIHVEKPEGGGTRFVICLY
jgi:signal transduction histidine kinase